MKASASSSSRHVALLRGINVGKAKRVAMADLRGWIEKLGYRDVKTLLNSGNVVFTVPAGAKGEPAARIEKAIAANAGFPCAVTVLTAEELKAVLEQCPLRHHEENPSRLLVCVFRDDAARTAAVALAKRDWSPEVFAVGRRAGYTWCPDGIAAGKLVLEVDRTLKNGVTARNWATMQKLLALAAGA